MKALSDVTLTNWRTAPPATQAGRVISGQREVQLCSLLAQQCLRDLRWWRHWLCAQVCVTGCATVTQCCGVPITNSGTCSHFKCSGHLERRLAADEVSLSAHLSGLNCADGQSPSQCLMCCPLPNERLWQAWGCAGTCGDVPAQRTAL